MIPFDPRQSRLKTERERLEKLNKESDYVRIQALNVLPGSEPEHYRVTFLCKGITGIDSSQKPLYAEKHQVEILCDEEFPADVPRLRWITPIWHPNIQHEEPKGVCVNKPEWLGGMGLDDLCRLMFEMVQYKNYHAEFTRPYPLDSEAARWVREYAEPRNIVNRKRKISVDNRPFLRPTVASRIKEVKAEAPVMPTPLMPARPRVVVVTPTVRQDQKDSAQPSSGRLKIVR